VSDQDFNWTPSNPGAAQRCKVSPEVSRACVMRALSPRASISSPPLVLPLFFQKPRRLRRRIIGDKEGVEWNKCVQCRRLQLIWSTPMPVIESNSVLGAEAGRDSGARQCYEDGCSWTQPSTESRCTMQHQGQNPRTRSTNKSGKSTV
jgi:hypothetical protein